MTKIYYNTENLITFSEAIKQLKSLDLTSDLKNYLVLEVTTPTKTYYYQLPHHQQTHPEGFTDNQITKLNNIFKKLHSDIIYTPNIDNMIFNLNFNFK